MEFDDTERISITWPAMGTRFSFGARRIAMVSDGMAMWNSEPELIVVALPVERAVPSTRVLFPYVEA
jgi:hypothetical protein